MARTSPAVMFSPGAEFVEGLQQIRSLGQAAHKPPSGGYFSKQDILP